MAIDRAGLSRSRIALHAPEVNGRGSRRVLDKRKSDAADIVGRPK
jgi:hypothetical protein